MGTYFSVGNKIDHLVQNALNTTSVFGQSTEEQTSTTTSQKQSEISQNMNIPTERDQNESDTQQQKISELNPAASTLEPDTSGECKEQENNNNTAEELADEELLGLEQSIKINNLLAKYYKSCNSDTYYKEDKRGLFLAYVIENGFDDDDLFEEILNTDPTECILLCFDEENFPISKELCNKEIKDEDDRLIEMHRILKYIYKHNKLPPPPSKEDEEAKKREENRDRDYQNEFKRFINDKQYSRRIMTIDADGYYLSDIDVRYNSWSRGLAMDSGYVASAPKKIEIKSEEEEEDENNNNNGTNHKGNGNKTCSTLPALFAVDNEQHLLLFGFFRKISYLLQFEWIIPIDVIDLCYRYLPTPNIDIFIINGNKRRHYMEYNWLTAQFCDYKHKTIRSNNHNNDKNEDDKHDKNNAVYDMIQKTKMIYKKLRFKVCDENGKEIKKLNEDFDCVGCGISFASSISFPPSLMGKKNDKFNPLTQYSAIIKCGGEIVDNQHNWCTNYCSAIIFDANQLLLDQEEVETGGNAITEKVITPNAPPQRGLGIFDTDDEDSDDDDDEEYLPHPSAVMDQITSLNNDFRTGNNAEHLRRREREREEKEEKREEKEEKKETEEKVVMRVVKNFSPIKEINCFELKLPKMPIKCQYQSIYSSLHGMIAMSNKTNSKTNIYQLSFTQNSNSKWIKLGNLKYNHLYGNMCMINGDNNLIVCGGNNSNKMEIYDMTNNNNNNGAWNSLTNICYNTKYHGIYYSSIYRNIIIGGGYDASSKSAACYDVVKNKWYKLPNTRFRHRHYPSLWHHVDNPSIVYIYGDNHTNIGKMEYIDLRSNEQNWYMAEKNSNLFISGSEIRNII